MTGIPVDLSTARLANRARRWAEQMDNPEASYRDKKLAMLSFLRANLSPEWTTKKWCMTKRTDRDYADIVYDDHESKAGTDGLRACGSVWVCPVCSDIISAERRHELKVLLSQTKYRVCMVTFTFSHEWGDPLKATVDNLNKALRAMMSKRAWRRFSDRWGLVGLVSSLEVTHGREHGWHPHKHMMFVLDPTKLPLSGIETRRKLENDMRAELFGLYRAELQRVDLDCDEEHGCVVSANRREYGRYIAKWGLAEELTRSTSKQASGKGRSVWELLADSVRGDVQAWALFQEYIKAFRHHKQLHWSKGLRALLALPVEEKTDEDIANEPTEEKPERRVVVSFNWLGWFRLMERDLLGPLLNYVERVQGDPVEVMAFLQRMGLHDNYAMGSLGIRVDLHPPNLDDVPPDNGLESIRGAQGQGQGQGHYRGGITQWDLRKRVLAENA